MKLPLTQPRPRRQTAFTMVEIAISLAVIAFALVAIIGVLPYGLTVQRENREDTIIGQDASVYLSAIRNGTRGMDDLTNYVFAITNYWTLYEVVGNTPASRATNLVNSGYDGYTQTRSLIQSFTPAPVFPLTNGLRIVGLLSRPKYQPNVGDRYWSNYVVAFARAMSGLATEKPPQTNVDVRADAFAYRLICENQQTPTYVDPALTPPLPGSFERQLTNNLRELRLTFRWPLSSRGVPGEGRQTFRAGVGGNLQTINDPTASPVHKLYFFRPATFERSQ